jgi:hypothetical protein
MKIISEERKERNRILKVFEEERRRLIGAARAEARHLWSHYRKPLTAGEVFSSLEYTLKGSDLYLLLLKHDKRWLGAVFKGWTKVGYQLSGSHCRPVAKWVPEEFAESFSTEN